ncbi:succinylglutamate-semialdehyde dehydrogenase [Planctomicrobium sp. SH527]|uniref:succinylglutamate-semialdehyde dehydrogenase n=1 Tax=Planctomicrobium sp. SH527 TaxID=3448123 RepID=UPI003F5BC697
MLFINGEWLLGGGSQFHSYNPANAEVLWTGNAATTCDVDKAVQAARQSWPAWRRTPLSTRVEIMERFRLLLQERQESLASLISQEVGKPLWDAATEVQGMIGKIGLTIHALENRRSPTESAIPGGMVRTMYVPLGVVAVYGPFNFPGHIPNGQIAPALLAGNTVVFKPSEYTPRVAEEIVRLWEKAGVPAGVLNLVHGALGTGQDLINHDEIDAVFFTGSYQTGVALQKALVERPEVLLALELGGNNPLVVHQVSDLDAAVYWTIQSAYLTSGQRCTCARRLIVTEGNEAFLEKLSAAVSQLKIGRPDDNPQPYLGPLIHAGAVKAVLDEQAKLVKGGAKIIVESGAHELGPTYVTPGLIDVTECSTISDHEVFGPLLQVIRTTGLQTALEIADQTQFGLVAAIFTDEREHFEQFTDVVRTGLLNWNRPTTGAGGQLPFGGSRKSGNHRPAGYFMIDACNDPVAIMESAQLSLPETLSPGIFSQ